MYLKALKYEKHVSETINLIKQFVWMNQNEEMSIDLRHFNVFDTIKIAVSVSVYHKAVFENGKITWIIKNDVTFNALKNFKLDNMDIILETSENICLLPIEDKNGFMKIKS